MSTHETSSTAADSEPWMCGSATFVTVTSSTCMMVTSITAAVMVHLRAAESGASVVGVCASVADAGTVPACPSAGAALPSNVAVRVDALRRAHAAAIGPTRAV